MSTFQNNEKYDTLLQKKQTNDSVVSCVFLTDFIILTLNLFILCF